uniref:Uncharacterized protein n=1 Tax=Pelusios castaneus TaxID=367368 RepID=A0A8C8S4J4_9SAUR
AAAEVGQRGRRGLVEQQRHGPRRLGPRQQHRVAAQHHRLVAQLVAVDPGEDARQARLGRAVGDAVQQVEVAGPARLLGGRHADALRADAERSAPGRWQVPGRGPGLAPAGAGPASGG